MTAGRPTKYETSFCEKVLEFGKDGMGKLEMAEELGIGYESFETYQVKHDEFSKAVKQALKSSQAWWERKGRVATFNSEGFNATSFIFNMKNRFKEDWRDKIETDHTVTMNVTSSQGEVAKRYLKRQSDK